MRMIDNALSGAVAAQTALTTSSQNVANSMTEGYTRQGVVLAAQAPANGDQLSAGYGVSVKNIRRFSDDYKTQNLWRANADLGEKSSAEPYLSQLEQVMGGDGTSISVGMDKFFSSLNAASVDPTSVPLRQQVISSADALSQRFNNLNQLLINQRNTIHEQESATIAQVNSLAGSIAALNLQVADAMAKGVNPSSLIDDRSLKLDKLNSLVQTRSLTQPDGTLSISLQTGQPLVAGGTSATMEGAAQKDGSLQLKLKYAKETFNMDGSQLGGQLGGVSRYEQTILLPMMEGVHTIAQTLADKMNSQLTKGFDAKGHNGKTLFSYDPTNPKGMMTIREGFVSDDLATTSDTSRPGNNDNLLAMISIKDQTTHVAGLGNVTLSDANAQLIGHLAIQSQQNQASLNTAKTVRTQAEENWKTTSGVNRDEEAINLVDFQQIYQANMKVISVANQLFESILGIL